MLLFSVAYVLINLAHRPELSVLRSPHPVLIDMRDVRTASPIVEAADPQLEATPGAWRRLAKNWSVRIGGGVLALLALMSLAAPWLGVDRPDACSTR